MQQIDFVDQQQPDNRPRQRRRGRPTQTGRAGARGKNGGVRDGHRRLTADIPSDLHKRLKMQALMEDRSVTDLVVQAAEYYLRRAQED